MQYIKSVFLVLFTSFLINNGLACTNLIVTKGASKDGACYLVYTNDGEWLYKLNKTLAQDHKIGDSMTFTSRYGVSGKIHQIPHTHAVLGFQMNEFQVSVGETTFTGREELWNKSKYLEYWHLMTLALQRARTAREAVEIMTSLADQYGYGSEGESFSIIDPNEAWILEMIGTGTGNEGAIWVAQRIPDGYVCAHANMSRIGEFPLDDPENCIYSENVISFAVEKGFYNPDSGVPFRFNEAYNPPSPDRLKYCETRVWSLFNRISPSLELSPDYHRGVEGAERYPLWIQPDEKLDLKMIMGLIRDHYEGTPYDMTKGLDAGPFGNPNRWRPLNWESEGEECSWERPISTYNTAFSFISQVRGWLPDEIGGLVWFGVDDTYFTCYVPFYACMDEVTGPFATGNIQEFDLSSAWWAFNLVSNYANIKYSYMIKDIQAVQKDLENSFLNQQTAVERTAMDLKKKKRVKYLTAYSLKQANKTQDAWVKLGKDLITKYNDGYVKNDNGSPESVGYPQEYYDQINKIEKKKFTLRKWKNAKQQDYKPF